MFASMSKGEERGCLAIIIVALVLALVGAGTCVYAAWWAYRHLEVVVVASGVDGHHKGTQHDVAPWWAGLTGAHHAAVEADGVGGGQKSAGQSSRHAPLVIIPYPRNWKGGYPSLRDKKTLRVVGRMRTSKPASLYVGRPDALVVSHGYHLHTELFTRRFWRRVDR